MRTRNVLVGSICPLLLALLLSACAKGPAPETTVPKDTTAPSATVSDTKPTTLPTTAPTTQPTTAPTEPPTEKAIPCTVSKNNGEISEEAAAYQLLEPYTVRAEGTPEEVLYAFASQAYPEALLSLPEDNPYNPLEYKLLEYGIRETFEDGFVGYILYWTERGSALPIVDAAASRPYKTEEAFREAYPDLDYNDVNCERVALVPQGDGTWVRVGAQPMQTLVYKTERLTKQRDPKNKYTIAGQNTLAQAKELIDQARSVEDDRESLIQLTEAFFRCLQAADHAGALDFDWTLFFPQEVVDGISMRALICEYVDTDQNRQVAQSLRFSFLPVDETHWRVLLTGNRMWLEAEKQEDGWHLTNIWYY